MRRSTTVMQRPLQKCSTIKVAVSYIHVYKIEVYLQWDMEGSNHNYHKVTKSLKYDQVSDLCSMRPFCHVHGLGQLNYFFLFQQ